MKFSQVLSLMAFLLAASCSTESNKTDVPAYNSEITVVFESKGAVQCESEGITVSDSAQKLINSGIDVIESHCAYHNLTDVMSVCGAGSNEIIIHNIPAQSSVDALELGFYEATDYSIYECS